MSFMPSARPVTADVRAAVTELCTEYVFRIDNGHADRVTELFAEDGSWMGPHGDLKGRAQLKAVWDERVKRSVITRHTISNIRLAWSAEGVLHGWITFTLFKADPGGTPFPRPELVAEHIDTYSQDGDGRWLFQSRLVHPVFHDGAWA